MALVKPEEIVYYILANNSAVSNEVGTRIYPVLADQTASYPHIVYEVTDVVPTNHKQVDTQPLKDTGFVTVTCVDEYFNFNSVTNNARNVREAMVGTSGQVDISGNDAYVYDIRFTGMSKFFDESEKIYRIDVDFEMKYKPETIV